MDGPATTPRAGGSDLARLIDVVSPWKLETANDCLAKFYFRYVERDRSDRYRAAMQLGNAFDATGNDTYRAKMKNGRTPSARDVQERFAAHWQFEADAVDDWQGETRGGLLDIGVQGAALWRDRVAAWVAPLSAQQDVTTEVQDVVSGDRFALRGIVDMRGEVMQHGAKLKVITDLKASGRRFQESAFHRKFQPVAYTLLTGTPTFQYHVVVTTKTPQTQIMQCAISDDDRAAFLRRAAMLRRQVATAHRTGDWLPNRASNLCSRRYCPHWGRCEKTFGGTVPA